MTINALIAQGGTPIGADVPQILNMLQQRAQQTLQNNRLSTQDQYAAEQHQQQTEQYNQGKEDNDAKQAYGESSQLLQIQEPQQLLAAVQQAPHILAALQQHKIDPSNPDAVRQAIQNVNHMTAAHLGIGPPAPIKLGAGDQLLAPPDPSAPPGTAYTTLATNVKPDEITAYQKEALALTRRGQDMTNARAKATTAAPAGGGLDKDTIHDAAIDVMADKDRMRQYATFGKAGQAMRVAINNEKTNILHSIGMTEPQLIRQQAIAKGQIKSTSDLVGMQNAVNAYETLAQGNGQRVIELANSVNTAGVPLLNSAERLGKLASGSPDAAELMLVLHNYQVEAARIVTQPSLKGQLTDQAIKDLKEVVPANMTPKQAVRLVNRLNFEFDLRQRGIQGSLDTAGGQITPGFPTGAKPASGTTPTAGATRIANDADYAKLPPGATYIAPDGSTRTKR